jgi:transcriptional regulator with GAF, ATPase, and Fis domain
MVADRKALAESVAELAVTLARKPTIADVLQALAEQAVAIMGVECASASLQDTGRWPLYAATDERSRALEQSQKIRQQGPSVEAYRAATVVTLSTVSEAPAQWAAFRSAASRAGIVAVAAVPLRSGDASVGAVGLYCTSMRDWSRDDLDAVQILSDLATGYVVTGVNLAMQERTITQLKEALGSRAVIEQAKGVLAAELGIPVGEAFELLRRHARNRGISLRAVAAAVVEGGLRP